jgi:hypothetical protein
MPSSKSAKVWQRSAGLADTYRAVRHLLAGNAATITNMLASTTSSAMLHWQRWRKPSA